MYNFSFSALFLLLCVYVDMYIYIYIYIYRERERYTHAQARPAPGQEQEHRQHSRDQDHLKGPLDCPLNLRLWALLLKGQKSGAQSGQSRVIWPRTLIPHGIRQVRYGRGRKGKHKCWKQSLGLPHRWQKTTRLQPQESRTSRNRRACPCKRTSVNWLFGILVRVRGPIHRLFSRWLVSCNMCRRTRRKCTQSLFGTCVNTAVSCGKNLLSTTKLRTKILDFTGFDSSRILL